MKKFLLATLVAMTLLLPAANFTSNAASVSISKKLLAVVEGWVLFATSNTEEGVINRIEVYRISTGERVRAVDGNGTNNLSVDVSGLPHGGYSAIFFCQNATITKQYKL